MTAAIRERVFAFVSERIATTGCAPTMDEIGEELGFSKVAAWKHVQALIAEGRLVRRRGRRDPLTIPGKVDLAEVSTEALVAELARRGRTPVAEAQP